jgi:hypothetical protein
VIEADPATAAGRLLRRLVADPVEAIRLPWGGSEFIYPLNAGGSVPTSEFHAMSAAFDDGISISSYRVARDPGQRVVVDLVFQITGAPPASVPKAFNHLLDSSENTVSLFDGPAYPELRWHDGDSCLSEFILPVPGAPGPYRLEFGLYEYPSMRRHQVTGPSTNSSRDAVDLDLLDLAPG